MFLTFEQQNSFAATGLAKRSDNGNLSTFKYARKVMYEYLWDDYPELLECRGHTYDNITGELITAAPRKTFNYLENGTWSWFGLDTKVTAYKKYNGFMACSVYYKQEAVISTTGSTKSDHVLLASEMIPDTFSTTGTSLWEIVVPQDPHIVEEQESGAVFLGLRNNVTGKFTPSLSTTESEIHTIGEAVEFCRINRGEGFMLYNAQGDCCKIKTEYYIGKKKLMRMSKSKVEQMWKNPMQTQDVLPKYWDGVVEYLLTVSNKSDWIEMTDQQRRVELEKFV